MYEHLLGMWFSFPLGQKSTFDPYSTDMKWQGFIHSWALQLEVLLLKTKHNSSDFALVQEEDADFKRQSLGRNLPS